MIPLDDGARCAVWLYVYEGKSKDSRCDLAKGFADTTVATKGIDEWVGFRPTSCKTGDSVGAWFMRYIVPIVLLGLLVLILSCVGIGALLRKRQKAAAAAGGGSPAGDAAAADPLLGNAQATSY